jgi:hypothetical protein
VAPDLAPTWRGDADRLLLRVKHPFHCQCTNLSPPCLRPPPCFPFAPVLSHIPANRSFASRAPSDLTDRIAALVASRTRRGAVRLDLGLAAGGVVYGKVNVDRLCASRGRRVDDVSYVMTNTTLMPPFIMSNVEIRSVSLPTIDVSRTSPTQTA